MRFKPPSIALPADMFQRTPLKNETSISAAEFQALRKAAIDKNRLPEFLKWLRNRKVVIK